MQYDAVEVAVNWEDEEKFFRYALSAAENDSIRLENKRKVEEGKPDQRKKKRRKFEKLVILQTIMFKICVHGVSHFVGRPWEKQQI